MVTDEPTSALRHARPTRVRWLIFVLACAASWLLYLHRYAWGIIKPAVHAENPSLDSIELGLLDSAFLLTYGIGQVPTGMAGDRFGPRAMLSGLALVWSLTAVGVAWVGGFWPLAGARALFGFAQAGVYPILNKMTRTWFPLTTRTAVQGAVTAMGRIGGACSSFIIATILMGVLDLSWQTALVVLSLPGMILAIAAWLVLRDKPSNHPWTNEAEQRMLNDSPSPPVDNAAIRAGEPSIRPAEEPRPALQLTAASLFSLAMLLLTGFCSTFQDQFYVYWLAAFLKDGLGYDNETMGVLVMLPLLGGAAGGVFGGILNDRLIRYVGRRWARSLVGFTGKFVAAALVVLFVQMEKGQLAMIVLMTARFFSDWSIASQWAAITDMGGRAVATVFGIVNTVGIVGGVVAGPVYGYLLKQEYGYDGLFYAVAVLCVASATTWLFIDCTRRLVDD